MAMDLARTTYHRLVDEDRRKAWYRAQWYRRTMRAINKARRVSSPLAYTTRDLTRLARIYGTDKWSIYHQYTPHYERHLAPLRKRPVRLLEIGIGGDHDDPSDGGASLRMWRRYFRHGEIHGMDLFDKSGVAGDRITVHQGDQSDTGSLQALGAALAPIDVLIDDGSHRCSHVIGTFHALFPYVRPGGIYIIEDLETSYIPRYEGQPPGPTNTETSVGMIKGLLDSLHHLHFPGPHDPSYADLHVAAVHVYPEMAVIEKAPAPRTSRDARSHYRTRR
jgi:hypothetical protein